MRPSDTTLLDGDVGLVAKAGAAFSRAISARQRVFPQGAHGSGRRALGDGPGTGRRQSPSSGVSLHPDRQGWTLGTIRPVGLAWREDGATPPGPQRPRQSQGPSPPLPSPDPFPHLLDVGFGRRMEVLFAHEVGERLPHLGAREGAAARR